MKLMLQIEGDLCNNGGSYAELLGHFLDLCTAFDDASIADEVWLTVKAKETVEER